MDRNAIKRQLLHDLDAVSFAMDETRLFLDTHPNCREALDYFKKLSAQRSNILDKYAQISEMEGYVASNTVTWDWIDSPWPWEA